MTIILISKQLFRYLVLAFVLGLLAVRLPPAASQAKSVENDRTSPLHLADLWTQRGAATAKYVAFCPN